MNHKEVKKKKKVKEEDKKTGEAVVVASVEKNKREKKVFDLPGQKRDPLVEREPLRIFYETLYEQIPTSEMSQIWSVFLSFFLFHYKLIFKKEWKRL